MQREDIQKSVADLIDQLARAEQERDELWPFRKRAETIEQSLDAALAEAAMCQTSLNGQIRRAEQAEDALVEMTAHRDQCRGTAIKWQMEANRAEAQAAIRGRAVQIYQQRARTAEAERDQERKWRLELDAAHDEEIENAEKAEARIKAVETMRDTLHLNYTTMSGPAVAAALTRALTA